MHTVLLLGVFTLEAGYWRGLSPFRTYREVRDSQGSKISSLYNDNQCFV